MMRRQSLCLKTLFAFTVCALFSFAMLPVDASGAPPPKDSPAPAKESKPVSPSYGYRTQCLKNHTDNNTKTLKKCWEAPVEVHVVFIEDDGVRTYVKNPENISVNFDNDANWTWSDKTALIWKKENNISKLRTNEQGIVTTGNGFMRVPNPDTGNHWLQNITFNITVNFEYTLVLQDRGAVNITKTEVKNITIPNNETQDLTTNYTRWFIFTYKWPRLFHKGETPDDHWEAGAGIVAFIIIAAVPTVMHFQRKKDADEMKRKEKEARFKI